MNIGTDCSEWLHVCVCVVQILENDETIDHPQPDGEGIRVGEEDTRAPRKSVL